MAEPRRVIILGAAGRDFHNFNVHFRDNPAYRVVAFTATQIPGIETRKYPASLAGNLYPEGIPIFPEEELPRLIERFGAQTCVFAYSDVDYSYIGHRIALANAHGAEFLLLGAEETMLKAKVPVIAVCAVRTGSGKSQTSRRVAGILRAHGKRVVVVRHPMPYGDLAEQAVQRYATYEDLDKYETTIEEREEYEPHIDLGAAIFAGVDYGKILKEAEKEADVVVWDGGNNDFPFYRSDLRIVVVDPLRPGHELTYHPGETNVRSADVIVINKEDTAPFDAIEQVRSNVVSVNPRATIVDAVSAIYVEDGQSIKGKRVLVVEDGPTLTHGEMSYGAGVVAARRFGAAEVVDPRPWAKGSLRKVYETWPVGPVLPAMGYSPEQVAELEATINAVDADLVLIATPIDLRRILRIDRPAQRVGYELREVGSPTVEDALAPLLRRLVHE